MILRKRLSDLFILFLLFVGCNVLAQSRQKIGTNSNNINNSAVLELESMTRGFLPPRMTHALKSAISSPAAGLIVWCTNCGTNGEMQVYNGVAWISFSGSVAATDNAVPGAPTSPVATAGNAQASVAFTAPAPNGGSAITSYTVTSSPGNVTNTNTSSPIIVSGLTNGTSYTFTVIATNAAGNSVASAASAAVKPAILCAANVSGISKVFMCYNLGATGTQDPLSYHDANNGTLYQWGRQTDGHEVRTSLTAAGPVAAPMGNRFITNSVGSRDWLSPQDNFLWLDASKTANDPCPAGFRVPSQAQWQGLFRDGVTQGAPNTATQNTWTWTGNGFTVGSRLFLPAAGYRHHNDGAIVLLSLYGFYWSSTVNGTSSYPFIFNVDGVDATSNFFRAHGFSVRCISE